MPSSACGLADGRVIIKNIEYMNNGLADGRIVGKKNDGLADGRIVGKKIDYVSGGLAIGKDDRLCWSFHMMCMRIISCDDCR